MAIELIVVDAEGEDSSATGCSPDSYTQDPQPNIAELPQPWER
jgi:hypothetical protein